MDANKRARGAEEKAAARPVPPPARSSDADTTPAPARAVRKTPVPGAAAPPPTPKDDYEPVATVEDSGAGAGVEEEEDDDEQVERFYALLANIRALRSLVPPPYVPAPASTSCGGADAGGSGATSMKRRPRAAEPPWRPAFRMEDFEEPAAPAPSTKRKRAECADDDGESAGGAAPPVLAIAPSPPHAAVRPDSGSCKN